MSHYSPVLASIALLLGGFVVFVLVTGVVLGILASGDAGEPPGKCRNSAFDLERPGSTGLRDAVTSPELAAQFQQRWDAFEAQLDAGSPASVTFEEGELTSRVSQWVNDTGASLNDVTICIYDGKAEGRATAEIPYLAKVPILGNVYETDVRVLGRIDLIGEHPEITVVELDAGDIPDWAVDPIQDDLEDIVNDRLADYDIEHDYTVTYREGQLEISGQP
jgi:hypothetical protein